MQKITVCASGEGVWPDLTQKATAGELVQLEGGDIQIAALGAGTESGAASVALRFDLPDGRVFLAETSLKGLVNALSALAARYKS